MNMISVWDKQQIGLILFLVKSAQRIACFRVSVMESIAFRWSVPGLVDEQLMPCFYRD